MYLSLVGKCCDWLVMFFGGIGMGNGGICVKFYSFILDGRIFFFVVREVELFVYGDCIYLIWWINIKMILFYVIVK